MSTLSEKKIKVLSLIGKVGGLATAAAGKLEILPDKFAWVGLVVVLVASTAKDVAMHLGDLWDDGKINKSYKPE